MQLPEDREAFLNLARYPLVKHSDMMADVREEALDISVTAVEKFPNNFSKITQVSQAPSGRAQPKDFASLLLFLLLLPMP